MAIALHSFADHAAKKYCLAARAAAGKTTIRMAAR
jgi:hypothetical protein